MAGPPDIPRALLADHTPVARADCLAGGAMGGTWRLVFADGTSAILKRSSVVPPDAYPLEAQGLRALVVPGGPRVPAVLDAAPGYLVLEDVGPGAEPGEGYWASFGAQVAAIHRQRGPRFGWHCDNYLGNVPQRNAWCDHGTDFYVENRVLRYFDVGHCAGLLTEEDRKGVERVCARFQQMVPLMPPVLLHGDFWKNNTIAAADGSPVVFDPAVHYGWAETDLSMAEQYGGFPEPFWEAYEAAAPLSDGWRERLHLFRIKEILSMVAFFGDKYLPWLRDWVAQYS